MICRKLSRNIGSGSLLKRKRSRTPAGEETRNDRGNPHKGLTKKYRRLTALAGVDLDVQEGAIYALVGQNGAGKTTAIKILMNLIGATQGVAKVLGTDSRKIRGKFYNQVGYVSENQTIPEWMKIGVLLDYLRGFYPTWDSVLERSLIKQFDLPWIGKSKAFLAE